MSPKTVLITGSTRGIGLEFAKHFTTAGWNVIGVARSAGTADELKALSPFKVVSFDCTDEASIAQAAQDLKGVPIDLLINNAGIYMPGELHTTTKDMLMRQFEVNTVGPFLVTRALLPNLKLGAEMNGKDGALVVTVSSQMGSIAGNTYGGNYSYGASKAAVNMVNSSLAIDLKKDNIAAIVVHPGYVVTDLTGGMGDVHTDESVRGMTSVIETVTMKDTGKFYHFQGHEMPW
ncbi:putative short chain dehydrogenase [Phytophthora cinnamomi]|uniref:putative short chain dehydrogenase n=1 Tax=Phytophthora cinnamomi TaxID=4785 RepID=UPI00355A0CB7|nr:putative short chain dehydrogenase [Phytophthora cinnamomi]